MNKVIYTIALAAVISLASCQKCQTCKTDTTQEVSGVNVTTSTSTEYCDEAYDNAPTEIDVVQTVGSIKQHLKIVCTDD
jgi:hypothetical protein